MRARVGRHARTGGKHCQNWADDQDLVDSLLNCLSEIQGGSLGKLGGRKIAGICADNLYQAICRFEDRWFPGQKSGFVDPDGPMYNKMTALFHMDRAASKKAPAAVATALAPKAPNPGPALDALIERIKKEVTVPPYAALVPSITTYLSGLKDRGVGLTPNAVVGFGSFHVRRPLDDDYNADDTLQYARTAMPGQRFITNDDGYAVLLFSDGGVLRMMGNSYVIIYGATPPRPIQGATSATLETGELERRLEAAGKK